ncbi:hypothetical protein NL676_024363 [Syzygium grande]|nr:hypothetical protein NL676_024363 [Syzygium grande]
MPSWQIQRAPHDTWTVPILRSTGHTEDAAPPALKNANCTRVVLVRKSQLLDSTHQSSPLSNLFEIWELN